MSARWLAMFIMFTCFSGIQASLAQPTTTRIKVVVNERGTTTGIPSSINCSVCTPGIRPTDRFGVRIMQINECVDPIIVEIDPVPARYAGTTEELQCANRNPPPIPVDRMRGTALLDTPAPGGPGEAGARSRPIAAAVRSREAQSTQSNPISR